MIQLLVNIRK